MNTTIKVAAVLRNKNGEILLIKEKYREEDGFKWNLIKGTYDNTSETLEECLKREISEEVGLSDLGDISLKRIFHYGPPENFRVLFVFYVDYLGEETPVLYNHMDNENIVDFKWFSKKDVKELDENACMSLYVYDSINIEPLDKVKINKI